MDQKLETIKTRETGLKSDLPRLVWAKGLINMRYTAQGFKSQRGSGTQPVCRPAPVPLDRYIDAINKQARGTFTGDETELCVGVISSGGFGERIPKLGPGYYIPALLFSCMDLLETGNQYRQGDWKFNFQPDHVRPYALYVDGQIIKLYDNVNNQLAPE